MALYPNNKTLGTQSVFSEGIGLRMDLVGFRVYTAGKESIMSEALEGVYSLDSRRGGVSIEVRTSFAFDDGSLIVFNAYSPGPNAYEGQEVIGAGINGGFERQLWKRCRAGGLLLSDLEISRRFGAPLSEGMEEIIASSTHIKIVNSKGGEIVGPRHIIPPGQHEKNSLLARIVGWRMVGKEDGAYPLAVSHHPESFRDLSVGFLNVSQEAIMVKDLIPEEYSSGRSFILKPKRQVLRLLESGIRGLFDRD